MKWLVCAVLLAACGGEKKGVCVQQRNCWLNQTEKGCSDGTDASRFVSVKGADEAIAMCKGWGYAFRDGPDEQKQRDAFKQGDLAFMGWSRELAASQAAAKICGSAIGPGPCTPWQPPK